MSDRVVIHWFRRDLRLSDNLALQAAFESGAKVVPLFILDPAILDSSRLGVPRLAFMLRTLVSLDRTLRVQGGQLLVRFGHPRTVLLEVAHKLRASAVYANRDYSPFARRRDAAVEAALDVPLRWYDDAILHAPGTVLKEDGEPYIVYTPFMRRWRSLAAPLHSVPPVISLSDRWHPLTEFRDVPIPALGDLGFGTTITVPDASEDRARRHLEAFAAGPIYRYGVTRNLLISDPFAAGAPVGTSYLSPHMRFGLISPRQAYWAA
jgi:deoxyribodipyrimidine photo-lyase